MQSIFPKQLVKVHTETLQTKRKEVETSLANKTYGNQKDLMVWKTQVLDEFDTLMRKFQAQYVQHKKWNSQEMQQQGEQALRDLAVLETVQLKTVSEYRTEISRIRVYMGMDLLKELVAPKLADEVPKPVPVINRAERRIFCMVCRMQVPDSAAYNHACQMPGCNRTFWLCKVCVQKVSHKKCPERSGCTFL